MIQTAAVDSSDGSAMQQQSALHYYRPHDGFGLGCPAPACFEERVSTAKGIHEKMELRDGELGESYSHFAHNQEDMAETLTSYSYQTYKVIAFLQKLVRGLVCSASCFKNLEDRLQGPNGRRHCRNAVAAAPP
jgi:hypothetical protein